ncbi:MAG TPA: cytochrome c oxidase assembly protein [Gemmatimonadales bacterium]|nr:cytochrome c oxidase assembly protein [Gemmatimonadales bacterium]
MILLHPGALAPHDLWRAWNPAPGVLAGLALAGGLYAAGVRRMWRAAGAGHGVARWRAACYAGGLAALALALVSPLDAFAEAVFWGHMVQHLVLILVAAPLLALGAPLVPLLWLLDPAARRRLGAWWNRQKVIPALAALLTTPLVAWGLHVLAIWAWHLPAAYQAALRDERVHALEHLSFLGTALLFWWVVLQPAGRRRMSYGMGLLYVVTAGMQGGLLGALLTFAGTPFYPAQSAGASAWGLTPLADQQLAGLIMWLPAGLVYVMVAGVLFVLWLRAEEARAVRRSAVIAATPVLLAVAVATETGCPAGAAGAQHGSTASSTHAVKAVPHVVDVTGSGGRREAAGILGAWGSGAARDGRRAERSEGSAHPDAEGGRERSLAPAGMKSMAAPFAPRRGPRPGSPARARQRRTGG